MATITEIKLSIDDLIDTSTSTFADARKVRGLNRAQDKIVNIIKQNDNLQEWDDNNWNDIPEGTLDIVSGQAIYNINEDENLADLLSVISVWFKPDAAATEYTKLNKTRRDVVDSATGFPSEYRLVGNNIILSPEPDYALADGLKVLFVRAPREITASDTTKEPGIPPLFHNLLALYTAYEYARAKNLSSKNDILAEVQKEEEKLGVEVSNEQSVDIDNVITNPSVDAR